MTTQVAEVTLCIGGGVRLFGDSYRPTGTLRGAVVLVHGQVGDRAHRPGALCRRARPHRAGAVGRPPPDRWPRRLEFVEGMSHSYQAAAVPAVGRALDWILGRDATAAA